MKTYKFTYCTLQPKSGEVKFESCVFTADTREGAEIRVDALIRLKVGQMFINAEKIGRIDTEQVENTFSGVFITDKENSKIPILAGQLHEETPTEPQPQDVDSLKNATGAPTV